MKRTIALVVALCLSGANLAAQDDSGVPAPPVELKKFDRMIGTWAGSGTAVMAPGQPEMPWTSKSRIAKALGGFFLEEVTVIDIGPEAPGPLVFRSFMGYDTQMGRYIAVGTGNMGGCTATRIHWVDDDTMVSVETGVQEGNVVVDRWVTTLGTDGYSFVGLHAVGGGDFFTHIRGAMKRADEPFECPDFESVAAAAPAGPEMTKLCRMAGRYRLAGTMHMSPDAPAMEVSGTETMTPIFDGAVLQATVTGDPVPGLGSYEAWAAFAWDPDRACYRSVYVNNMGEIDESEARFVGNHLVSTSAQLRMGLPAAARHTIYLDAKGTITRVVMHSLVGEHEPCQEFDGTYTLVQD